MIRDRIILPSIVHVVVATLLSVGTAPSAALAFSWLDHDHDIYLAIEHGAIHVRVADAPDHRDDRHAHHGDRAVLGDGPLTAHVPHVANDGRGDHGIHVSRPDQQRVASPTTLVVPVVVASDRYHDLLVANADDAPRAVPTIRPGIEHGPPPDLQRTVILLI